MIKRSSKLVGQAQALMYNDLQRRTPFELSDRKLGQNGSKGVCIHI